MVVHNRGRFSRAAAANVKRARLKRGWGTDKLEDHASLGRGTASRIESGTRGQSMSVDVLHSFSTALGLSLDELVYGASPILQQIAEALGCEAELPVVLERCRELVAREKKK